MTRKRIYTAADIHKVSTEDLMKVLDLWSKLTPVGKVHFRAKYANMDEGLKAISAELNRRTMALQDYPQCTVCTWMEPCPEHRAPRVEK